MASAIATFWCITVDPGGAPTIRPIWSPTAHDVSHQPSAQARIPRSSHMRANSASRSAGLARHRAERVVDEVGRVLEDREL